MASCAWLVAGFGLFKAVLDQAYSSALFTARSAYPIVNNVGFSIAASFAILAASLVVMLVSWRRPDAALRAPAVTCLGALLAVDCASAAGLLEWLPAQVVAGLLPAAYGAAAVVTNAAWLLPIAYLPARWCLGALASSYLLAKVASEVCSALPEAMAPPMVLVMGVASIVLLAASRRLDASASETAAAKGLRPVCIAREVVVRLAGPLAVFVALNAVLGLITAFQVMGEQAVEGSSFLKAVASGAANLLLLAVAVFAKGMPSIRRAFGLLFPVVALLLAALPFMDHVYGALFGVLLMFLQGVVSSMVLFMLLEMAKRYAVPVIATVAAVSFVSRVSVLLGLLIGGVLGSNGRLDDTVRALIVVVVALYLLSLVLVWLLRGRAGSVGGDAVPGREFGTFDELDGLYAAEGAGGPSGLEHGRPDAGGAGWGGLAGSWPTLGHGRPDVGDAHASDPVADPLDSQGALLAQKHRLTVREAQVGLLLARGRSASYIADALGISLHTVRGYIKDVYAKLGVHAKQELIDLYTEPKA